MKIPIQLPNEIILLEKGDYFWETSPSSSLEIIVSGLDQQEAINIDAVATQLNIYIQQFYDDKNQIVGYFINDDFFKKYAWLKECYFYKYKEPFPVELFKKSIVLKSLHCFFDKNEKLDNVQVYFQPAKIYSFGFQIEMEGFKSMNNLTDVSVGFETDYDYEACIEVLRSPNHPNFSGEILFFLYYMDGYMHQGTLYAATAQVTIWLIECIDTCHPDVQKTLLHLLVDVKSSAMARLEFIQVEQQKNVPFEQHVLNEKQYCEEVLDVFQKYAKITQEAFDRYLNEE